MTALAGFLSSSPNRSSQKLIGGLCPPNFLLQVADELEIGVEVEVENGETELEIALTWSRTPGGSEGGEPSGQ